MIVYLNGKFLPDDQALIPVLDRGFIFGDGVYEVIPVYWGKPFRLEQHLARLNDSLRGIRMENPLNSAQWTEAIGKLIQFNVVTDSMSVYLQVTRGPARRDHAIPAVVRPTTFLMLNPIPAPDPGLLKQGVTVVTLDDIRWKLCNIKATTLLASVLLKDDAARQGAYDAILVRSGRVTEGTASNVFVISGDTVRTPPKDVDLLPGITRDVVLELAQHDGINCVERAITPDELETADEIWLTSSTKEILPVTRVNDRPVGFGKPGPMWRRITALYQKFKLDLRDRS
jgi:D-alanine transaminase